jgi:molybdate transport system regulatory protein
MFMPSSGSPPARRVSYLKTSTRNMLRGVVTSIVHGPINAEVGVLVNDRLVIDAVVTNRSVDDLDLEPGRPAMVLINSAFVILVRDVPGLRMSARNQIGGTVTQLWQGQVETEVVMDIGGGTQLAAVVTTESARDLELAVGAPITACIKATHIILAVEQ